MRYSPKRVSQAIRLPKEFRLDVEQVEIFRRGDEIVLREHPVNAAAIFDALANLPADLLAEGREDVAPLPEAAGEHYGQIRAALQRKGEPIGNNDLWLAAHARAEAWILVTNNEREFLRVEGLQVENWVGE